MSPDGSLMDSIMSSSQGEDISALNMLLDTRNLQRLKMLSEVPPSLIYVMSIIGLVTKRYKSTVLKDFESELLTIQKSRDRKGIGEFVEIMLGLRRADEGGE